MVAGNVADFGKLGQGRRGNGGTGGDDKMFCPESFWETDARAFDGGEVNMMVRTFHSASGDFRRVDGRQFQRVWIREARVSAEELELRIRQLLAAIAGEILDHPILASHHFREIKSGFRDAQTPGARVSGEMKHLGRVEQRLRWHAAAQDAETAHFSSTFNDDGFQPCSCGCSCRRKTSAAAANNCDVVVELRFLSIHERKMEEEYGTGKGQYRCHRQ